MGNEHENQTFLEQGKINRNEIPLPKLLFIATDDWIDKLGETAFIAWLRLYSMANRKDVKENVNPWEQSTIPYSLSHIRKKLGVGSSTFSNKVIKPLWNYGFIDIETYESSKSKGTPPKNIIVYQYPQNKYSLTAEPLQKVRDYDTEYISEARKFAKKGGRPKKSEARNKQTNSNKDVVFESKVEKTNLPLPIQKTLITNKQNFINKNLSIDSVKTVFEYVEDDLTSSEFALVLGRVLDAKKMHSSNFHNYLHTSLNKFIADSQKENESNNTSINNSSEVIPDWFDEKYKQPKENTDSNKKGKTIGDWLDQGYSYEDIIHML